MLTSHEIVSRQVQSSTPQYNGAVECGGKKFKNVFYTQWVFRPVTAADKDNNLLEQATEVAATTIHLLNEVIPRPALGGVTPVDVQHWVKRKAVGRKQSGIARRNWVIRSHPSITVTLGGGQTGSEGRGDEHTKEVPTRLAFFGMRPLRRFAQPNREVWGN